jgi:SNF2 family DNA or RNA helicase
MKTPADQIAWNDRQVDILLAHPASAAYGLNLQAGGNHLVWFGLTWSLELYQQANARLHRQGQGQVVIIHRLIVRGGLDEDVAEALENKGNTQEQLMRALQVRVERIQGDGK